MKKALVDVQLLVDIIRGDPDWLECSLNRFQIAQASYRLSIDPITYLGVSFCFTEIDHLESVLAVASLQVIDPPRDALFLAGQALALHSARNPDQAASLPELLVGAHAFICNLPLLTRDEPVYRAHFPGIRFIDPLN